MLDFEWDEEKSKINLAKHGIAFENATFIFLGITLSVEDDREDYGEIRIKTTG